MSNSYDIVTVGSGHNGLVAAAYLAAAGKKVLVLERNAWFGGGVVTRALTVPGYLHDQHSMAHIFIQANPLLKNDELKLKAKHGLKYVFPELPMMSVFEDGTTLGLYRDREKSCAEIAKFSKKDAETYRWLAAKAAGYLPMIAASLYAPPAPLGATYALMDQSREGRELWRYMQMSSHDLLCSLFEHDKVRMHFARVAGENLVSPDEKATGLGVFVFVAFLEAYGIGVPVGGSGKLTDALIASIREHGGEVLGERRRRAHQDEERPRRRRRDAGRPLVRRERRRHRGAAPARLGQRWSTASRPRSSKRRSDTQISEIGCITRARGAQRPAEVPRRRARARRHDRALAEQVRHDPQVVRLLALRRVLDVSARRLGLADDVRRVARAAGQGHDARLGLRAVSARRRPQLGRHEASLREAHAELTWRTSSTTWPAMSSPITATAPSTWSARRRASAAAICTASRRRRINTARTARRRISGGNVVPGCERLYLVGPFQHPGGGVFGAGRAAAMRAFEDLEARFRESRSALMLTLYSPDNSKLMEVEALERSGNEL